jgi:hypothetical protein
MVLHTVVVENFLSYIGTNGDPLHNSVMRKMYPSATGETFTLPLKDSINFTRNISWSSDWTASNCEIIAFVQIQGTKEVLQAAKKSVDVMIMPTWPFLLFPPQASIKQPLSVQLKWLKDLYTHSYRIQLSVDSTFTTTILDTSGLLDTSFTISCLAYRTKYHWRIQGKRNSYIGQWSTVSSFTTRSPSKIYSVESGWNIISVPLNVDDWRKTDIYPSAVSGAFVFNSGYSIQDTLSRGTGYWVKFSSGTSLEIFGTDISEDSINVVPGWNLIGSISAPVLTSFILTDPPNLLTSKFWLYSPNYGYQISEAIQPGNGYWIKVNQAGKIFLTSSGKKITK